jgi:NAD+ kinase
MGAKPFHLGLVANRGKSGAVALIREVQALLPEYPRVHLHLEKRTAALLKQKSQSLETLARKCDLILVAGGDGTMLEVGRSLFPHPVPIIGVNLGHLGFLTSFNREQLPEAFPLLFDSKLRLSPRLALRVKIHRGTKSEVLPCTLNDIVVSRGNVSRLVRLRVRVGGFLLNEYLGDGLIVATATGSTAYSMAAGGPIISPEARALVLTPICAHTLTNQSLVLGSESQMIIEVPPQPFSVVLQADGQPCGTLHAGDWIEISAANEPVNLAYLPNSDFFTILRQKLKWSGAHI